MSIFLYPQKVEGAEELSGMSFIRALIPFMSSSLLWTKHLPKILHPNMNTFNSRIVVQLVSHVRLFATPWTAAHQASLSFTTLQSLLKLMSIELVMLSNHFLLCLPLLLPLILPNIRVFFQWVSSSHQVSKILELQLQYQSFQWIFRVDYLYNWLVWSPCSSRDSQESSSAPQFESFNYLALSFLYVTTLISIYDHWKNHSFNYSDLCGQNKLSAF